MLVLGIETSCDETGIALYHNKQGLLSHALYSQIRMHSEYGGVVPELASRDHIRRVLPLIKQVLTTAKLNLKDLDAIAYTQGPGLAGALLVGASIANALSFSLKIPAIGIHHLEGHLLSAMLSTHAPIFPFVALLVSGGHTQLMEVRGLGLYKLLGETLDDAAGEAFDKTAKLLGLGYPGGPALSELADTFYKFNKIERFKLPRPMLHSGDLNFSFSGLKTAVLTLAHKHELTQQTKAEIAFAFQKAMVDVLTEKSLAALAQTGLTQLVVAGGVGANRQLRNNLDYRAEKIRAVVFYPEFKFCTDNGAMIALAGLMRLQKLGIQNKPLKYSFTATPRWDLEML
ncbi:MAG: tRNA (adenosine(37)-N6)-threonylcarbamoyltransferase complex transferase subunit TsaD [Nitrosospira sp.]|nr:tRNA (adenosine(37)-N6)-threonylcarbamoyltransferase complex transferase subunit TsaD [Nitrosospira sp.]MDW7642151.1 tRNA (adenosine(37)-N6)-threonylcarbamoyltransferase complex transferase subunit TsaD [Nitrosomonadaceae bacterium]MBI0407826.1 tRNA (adenosine(37)-N6)-threonylcarbamoyltransferase complex transferase subunit TsaD [Nitrosospira sp.]MBI0414452.1 tRNA (adenosine(37)-N6)-threonylcarbamoyltransferase complex transferase subunit TsaD [Nitrosospira sp.]MBI0416838.1 tRNA (adenosine(3